MAAVYPAGPEPTITTLAWVVFVMLASAPLAGVADAQGAAGGRTLAGSSAVPDVWLPAELCKIRNPSRPQAGQILRSRSLERAILFREILFRGMNVREG